MFIMKISIDLAEEMKDYHIWKNFVIEDLMEKHFSHFHEDTRWIKYVFIETINNYKDGLSFVEKLFNETFNDPDISERENILTGIMYCLKYTDYDKIKDIAIPLFNKAITVNDGDLQEILIMMYYDDDSKWRYNKGIELLESKRPFIRKYLETYFEEVKIKISNVSSALEII